MSRQSLGKIVLCFSFALTLAVLLPAGAMAQCDDLARAEFAEAVASGWNESDLEGKFGLCRTAFAEPNACEETAAKKLPSDLEKIKVVTNQNTSYERMNGCGYHPQAEMVACDVEVRRTTGYGGFPGGSFEHVRFCFDCDRNGTWDYTTLGFVHVTDNAAAGPVPSWYHLAYATTFAAPANCTQNNGQQTNVRAILSWAQVPPSCTSRPFWGNTIDFTARRDP